ncbi:MAG: AsmA family protein, partial [Planctomycetota bacterium]
MKRVLRWFLRIGLGLAVLLVLVYLLRWPLFGGYIRDEIRRLASESLGGDVEIADLEGTLISSIGARGITLKPGPDSRLRKLDVKHVEVTYGLFGLGSYDVTVTGADVALAPSKEEDETPPPHETARDALKQVDDLRLPASIHVRDAAISIPDQDPLVIHRAELAGSRWEASAHQEKLGTVEAFLEFHPDGSVTAGMKSPDGPLSSATAKLGPTTERKRSLNLNAVYAGEPRNWTGELFLDEKGRVRRADGRLEVKEGYARTVVNVETGWAELDVDAVIPVENPVQGNFVVRGRAEGPLTGFPDEWIFDDIHVGCKKAVYKDLTIDTIVLDAWKGTHSGIPFRAALTRAHDQLSATGTVRLDDGVHIQGEVKAAAAELAPYLALIEDPPDVQAENLSLEGMLVFDNESFRLTDGRGSTGPGSASGRKWDSIRWKGSFGHNLVQTDELVIEGTDFGTL